MTNKGSKLGKRAKVDLSNAQKNGAAPNVPLIQKTFGELIIVDGPDGRVIVAKMPANFLKGKLTNALDSQKSTFTKQSAGVTKLQNAKANLVNSNQLNHAKCAPMATAPLNKNSQSESDYDDDENLSYLFEDLSSEFCINSSSDLFNIQ